MNALIMTGLMTIGQFIVVNPAIPQVVNTPVVTYQPVTTVTYQPVTTVTYQRVVQYPVYYPQPVWFYPTVPVYYPQPVIIWSR